jgi:hypothetical protein
MRAVTLRKVACPLLLLVVSAGCATSRAAHDTRYAASADALAALQAARFEDAEAQAQKLIAADAENATAHGVAAIAVFRRALHELYTKGIGIVAQLAASALLRGAFFDTSYLAHAIDEVDGGLAQVATHLDAAARDPFFELPLCLACWEVDWNRNGEVDDNDRRLLEVEVDAELNELPENDLRRRPTFRFDLADVHWLKALVSFARSVGQVVRAYDVSEVARLAVRGTQKATLRLKDKERVGKARALVLAGLDAADTSRALVLAETDDDREWLPNPKQKQHPLPFPVDEALFETWAGVLGDVRALVQGKTGLALAELAELDERAAPNERRPKGFIDIGRMFDAPADIVAAEGMGKGLRRGGADAVEALARDFFGAAYRDSLPASPLPQRLLRMKGELDRGEDRFERKLRYLLWLN